MAVYVQIGSWEEVMDGLACVAFFRAHGGWGGIVCGGEDFVVEGGCGGLCCWFLGTGKGSGWGGLAFDWDLFRGGNKFAVGFYRLR